MTALNFSMSGLSGTSTWMYHMPALLTFWCTKASHQNVLISLYAEHCSLENDHSLETNSVCPTSITSMCPKIYQCTMLFVFFSGERSFWKTTAFRSSERLCVSGPWGVVNPLLVQSSWSVSWSEDLPMSHCSRCCCTSIEARNKLRVDTGFWVLSN